MQLDIAPRFARLMDRNRRARRESDAWLWATAADGAILCRTHADSAPHTYVLRHQPDGGLSCTCPDYARAPRRDDGSRDACKHQMGWWLRSQR